jgi:hypothetical protein
MAVSPSVLLQNIKKSADDLGAFNPGGFKPGIIKKELAEAILAKCSVCLANLASALDAGMEESAVVSVTLEGQNEPKAMTIAQLQAWCIEIEALANERVYRARIQQALVHTNVWVSELQEVGGLNQDQAMCAAETGRYLLQVLLDAQAAGVSNQIRVELNGEPLTLSEVKALGEYVVVAGSEFNERVSPDGNKGIR